MAPSSLKGYRVCRPVPVMRNAGTAYAERRYQLGAVLSKPLSARIRKAMKVHVAKRAALVNDRERSYNMLVRDSRLADDPNKADVHDLVYLEAMPLVNNL